MRGISYFCIVLKPERQNKEYMEQKEAHFKGEHQKALDDLATAKIAKAHDDGGKPGPCIAFPESLQERPEGTLEKSLFGADMLFRNILRHPQHPFSL